MDILDAPSAELIEHRPQATLSPTAPSFQAYAESIESLFAPPVSSIAAPTQSSASKTNAPNTVQAPDIAVFSTRVDMCSSASLTPFELGETGVGEHGDDDGIRIRVNFTVNPQVFGTYINSVYHPAGTCNARRVFRRSIGGGGCPPLFLYYLPSKDSWVIGLKPGDENVYAFCGPAQGNSLAQPWKVWSGTEWVENPPSAAAVQYRNDQQTARWEDQQLSQERSAKTREAHHGVCQKLYNYAVRGGLNPKMEKGGILQDLAVLVATNKIPSKQRYSHRKLAWDVKVINSNDGDRYGATDKSPVGVVNACREWCIAHHDTAKRCAEEKHWLYVPLVLTMQGVIQNEVENAISLLAMAISHCESRDIEQIHGEVRRGVLASLG